MSDIPRPLADEVIRRAGNRCEYCRLSQQGQEAAFHIDHVIPRSATGPTTFENLALACVSCSLRKGAKQTAIDSETGEVSPLFNPREQQWNEHFRWEGERLESLTVTGRVTIAALKLNRATVLAIRYEERLLGRHPTP